MKSFSILKTMNEGEKEPTEEWNLIDVISISFAVMLPLIIMPISLFALGEGRNAILMASASWLIVTFYESSIEKQWKNEVLSRVG